MLRNIANAALRAARPSMTARPTTMAFRGLATQAKAKRQPIQFFDTNGKYGHALYNIALENGAVEAVEGDLATFLSLADDSDAFASFLHDPTVTAVRKAQNMSEVLSGTDFQPLTKEFFVLLARNSRLNQYEKVINSFFDILNDAKGEVKGKVVSAEPLTAAQLKGVQDALSAHIDADQTLILDEVVDPSLLGGLQISVGNKYADLSIATRIKKATEILEKAGQSY